MGATNEDEKIIKKIFIIILAVYIMYTFISQQKVLNSYKTSQEYYTQQIEEKLAYKETLNNKKNNINSEEYIEEAAREKLDMYLPNERVYIDTSK